MAALLTTAILSCLAPARAANGLDTWNSAGTNVNFSGAGNWTGANTPPVTKDSLYFGADNSTGTTAGDVLTDNLTVGGAGAWTFSNLTFTATSPGYTINAGTAFGTTGAGFTLGTTAAGTVLNQSNSTTVTINEPIALATASQTFALIGNLTLGGVVSGGGTLVKTGAGVITLNNAETFTGGITVSGGVLTIGSAGSLGSGAYAGAISVTGATNNFNGTGAQTLSGVISGTGVINLNAGSVSLTASNTFSGKLYVNNSAALTVISGSTLPAAVTNAGGSALTENVRTTGSQWVVASLAFTGSTPLALNFTNAISPSIPPLLVTGPLNFGSAVTLTINGSTNPISGGVYPLITATGGMAGTAPTTANGNVTIHVPAGVTATVVQSGNTLNLVVSQGTVVNAVDTWNPSGSTASWAGTSANNNWTGGNAPPITGDGLIFGADNNAGSATAPVADTLNDNLTIGGVGAWTFTNLTFTGSAPAFTFVPATAGGTGPGAGFTLGTATAGTVINQNSGSPQTINEPLALAAAKQTISLAAGNLSLGGVISGAGGLILNANGESGTLTLTNNATGESYTGPTVVGSGQLNLGPFPNGGTSGISLSSSLTISNNATVWVMFGNALAGSTVAIGSLPVTNSGTLTFNGGTGNDSAHLRGVLTLIGGTLSDLNGGGSQGVFGSWDLDDGVVVTGTTPSTMSALDMIPDQAGGTTFNVASTGNTPDLDVSGTLINGSTTADTGIIKQGAGTMQLDGVNTYAGPTTITAGTLTINSSALLGGAAGAYAGLITNNGTLNYNGTGAQTFSGAIRGTGALNVNAGNLTLSGVNGYTGATTVASSANLTVLSGGSSHSAITMASSTIFSNSVVTAGGQWRQTNNISFTDSSSVLAINFNNNPPNATAPILVNGTVAFGTSSSLVLYGNSLLPAGTYPLITATSLTGTVPTTANGFASVNLVGVAATVVQSGNTLNLVVSQGTAPIIWGVGSGTWNKTSANWVGGALYADGDGVTFPDNAGPSPATVTLNSIVAPSSVIFSNSAKNYILSGTGGIQSAGGLTEQGAGSLTISTTNTLAGATIVTNGGTLVLDYTQGATTPIIAGSALALGGGATLNVLGSATLANDQAFTATTFTPGPSLVEASGANVPTVDLGAVTATTGTLVEFIGPAANTNATAAGGTSLTGETALTPAPAATATIRTTTAGATTGSGPLLGGLTGGIGTSYATVGLYDWAVTQTDPNNASVNDIIGGSQLANFYVILNGANNNTADQNYDVTGNSSLSGGGSSRVTINSIRFNVPAALTVELQPGQTGHAGNPVNLGGILVTPNVGTNNTSFTIDGSDAIDSSNTGSDGVAVWQNNLLGELLFPQSLDGPSFSIIAGNGYVQGGPGTVSFTGLNSYGVGTFLNGGVLEIAADVDLGTVTTPVDLNGGTLVGNYTGNLDNGTSTAAGWHPIGLGGIGGGVGATAGNTFTVDGVVSNTSVAAIAGPLVIGIPASSANGSTLGQLPGTGANTANPAAVLATGTVVLNNTANTYTGGTIIDSGTLLLSSNSLAPLGTGGISLNGGTFQWKNGVTTDISTKTLTVGAGNGTLDVNGSAGTANSITLANGIGNGGSGALTVASSFAGGSLTLSGVNTYTGGTTVNPSTTLRVNGSLAAGPVVVNGTLGGTGSIGGSVTANSGASLLLTAGSPLTVSGAVALNGNAVTVLGSALTATGSPYTLLIASGGFGSSTVSPTAGGTAIAAGYIGAVSISGTSLLLTVTAVPSATWTDADGNGNWTDPLNWTASFGTPPPNGAQATAIFGTGAGPVTLNANETVGTLAFNSATIPYIISGAHTLTLDASGAGAAITMAPGAANAVVGTAVSLNDNVTATVSGGDTLALTGNISSTSAGKTIALNGAGTTVLAGANTYGPAAGTVGTTLSGGGTLRVGSSSALGAGDVASANASTLQAGAAGITLANNLALAAGFTTVDDTSNSLTLSGVITGSGNLTKTGNNPLTLSAANTYSGGTTVNGGFAGISADGATAGGAGSLGAVPATVTAANVTLNSGGLLGTASLTLNTNRGITLAGTGLLDAAAGVTFTVNGNISGAGGLTVNSGAGDTGTVVLAGTNPFGGTTLLNAGTLTLGSSLALEDSTINYVGGSLSFGTLTAATIGGLTGSQNLACPVVLTIGNSGTTSYSGLISGSGSLLKAGTGSTTLGVGTLGGAALTGSVTVQDGSLTLGGVGSLNAGANTIQAGSFHGLETTTTLNVVDSATVTTTGTIVVGQVSGVDTYVTVGGGTGGGALSGGTLTFGTPGQGPGVNIVTVQDGGSLVAGTVNLDDGHSASQAGSVTINLAGGVLVAGDFMATYANATYVTLAIDFNGGVLGASTNDPAGGEFLPVVAGLTLEATNPVTPAFINSSNYEITIAAPIVGNGAGVVKQGSGTLILSGANTYTSLTTVSNGILLVSGAVNNSAENFNVNDGAAFGAYFDGSDTPQVGTLTLGQSAGAGLVFTNLSSTTAAALHADFIYLNGRCDLTVQGSASLVAGSEYPLVEVGGLIVTNNGPGFTLTLPGGVSGYLTNDTTIIPGYTSVALVVTSIVPYTPPSSITSLALSGTSLVLNATGGTPGAPVNVLTTTNLALPLAQWTTNSTTAFDANGNLVNYTISGALNAGVPRQFFRLSQ